MRGIAASSRARSPRAGACPPARVGGIESVSGGVGLRAAATAAASARACSACGVFTENHARLACRSDRQSPINDQYSAQLSISRTQLLAISLRRSAVIPSLSGNTIHTRSTVCYKLHYTTLQERVRGLVSTRPNAHSRNSISKLELLSFLSSFRGSSLSALLSFTRKL